MLDKQSKIYVAGHNGLVGYAIWNNLLCRREWKTKNVCHAKHVQPQVRGYST